MSRTISLDGPHWTVEGFLGLDGALGAAARPGELDRPAAMPAVVPGSILDDVWRAGQVPNPYVGLNSLASEWVPQRAWLYRRRVETPTLAPGERAWLSFDGLDHAGEVFWDGTPIGRHEGMFAPFELDLSSRLGGRADGVHELAVVVEPAPESEPQTGRTSRVRVHKSRMSYGWDFCPRMVNVGLWKSVSLETAGDVRILEVWGRPRLSADLRAATVDVRIAIDAAIPRSVRFEAALVGPSGGRASSRADVPAGVSDAALELSVHEPALWWPNGTGRPVVHRLTVRATGDGGETLAEVSVPLGFRTIERIPNEDGAANARPWTWVVNGRRIYVKGWNWVPMDALYGGPRPERLTHLIGLARDANVNLLRVWGGGLIETRPFYDACDANGLLVWQELAQSSSGGDSVPSADPAFVDRIATEAVPIVRRRRNHPSLAVWCGGNELEGPDGPLDEASSPVLGRLRDVVAALDPERAWLPTSPSGPQFHNRPDVIAADPQGLHDVHGPWEHQGLAAHYELYNRGTSLFNSEFGVEGMTNRRTHEALVPPEQRWPPTRSNRVYRHLGDWWINEALVQTSFGGRLRDLETLRRASQHLQADGLRYAVEANRRRAFHNSGSIPWQLNESYPNAWCTSAVDHRGDPKLAYFAVRRAYAPTVVAASFERAAWGGADAFEAGLWAWSDSEEASDATAMARVVDVDGRTIAEVRASLVLRAGEPVRWGSITAAAPLPPLFLLDLQLDGLGGAPARNRYVFSGGDDMSGLLEVPPAELEVAVSVSAGADRWEVRLVHRRGPSALGIRLEDDRPIDAAGWAEVEDGGFELLPGEDRTVGVAWTDAGDRTARRLRLSGWNVPDTEVVAP